MAFVSIIISKIVKQTKGFFLFYIYFYLYILYIYAVFLKVLFPRALCDKEQSSVYRFSCDSKNYIILH